MPRIHQILLLFLVFSACQTEQNQTNIAVDNPIQTESKSVDTKHIDSFFPMNLREKLENADEFEVLSWTDYPNGERIRGIFIKQFTVSGTKLTKVTDREKQQELLKSIYFDIESLKDTPTTARAACFIPKHIINAKYKDEFIVIAFCYECGNFYGVVSKNQFGNKILFVQTKGEENFGGSFPHSEPNQSMAIFDRIINEQ